MKKFLKIFFITLLVIIVLVIAFTVWTYMETRPLRDDAQKIALQTITDFSKDYDWSVVTAHGGDKWMAAIKGKDLASMSADLKNTMGKLQSIGESDCNVSFIYMDGKHTYAQCFANVSYEKDNVTVTVNMEQIQNSWQIMGMNFNRTYTKK